MILSVTLSKPVKNVEEILGSPFIRIKIKRIAAAGVSSSAQYFCEQFTEKQVFHKKISESELESFLAEHAGTTFKSCVKRCETEEIQILANKKGKITEIRHPIATEKNSKSQPVAGGINFTNQQLLNKKKSYILEEGKAVPFLVLLGIMTADGRVVKARYDKFRQINRFLEFVDDILDDVLDAKKAAGDETPLRVVDFGSGKSYLTFALQYFFSVVKHIDAEIFGLDLKKDVIDYCQSLADKLSLSNLKFAVGDISEYKNENVPDIVVTLHACDTATDYALDYAVSRGVRAILSVPCCQHELNLQLKKGSVTAGSALAPLLKYGLIKERFAALATDAVRAELLEKRGYSVQILEFIDESNTPKNLLIRAIKKAESQPSCEVYEIPLLSELGANLTLLNLFKSR